MFHFEKFLNTFYSLSKEEKEYALKTMLLDTKISITEIVRAKEQAMNEDREAEHELKYFFSMLTVDMALKDKENVSKNVCSDILTSWQYTWLEIEEKLFNKCNKDRYYESRINQNKFEEVKERIKKDKPKTI